MNDDLFEKLKRIAEVERDVPLSTMTTLRIGGPARYVVYPDSTVALDALMRLLSLQTNRCFRLSHSERRHAHKHHRPHRQALPYFSHHLIVFGIGKTSFQMCDKVNTFSPHPVLPMLHFFIRR